MTQTSLLSKSKQCVILEENLFSDLETLSKSLKKRVAFFPSIRKMF